MTAVVDPRQADAVNGGRRRRPRCGSTSRQLQKKALELISAPKGVGPGTMGTISSANGNFWGCRNGATIADDGPQQLSS
jgi:hypothetical protein